MPTFHADVSPAGAIALTIDLTPTEAAALVRQWLDATTPPHLAPSCLTPAEIARVQQNGQLTPPAPATSTRPHVLCACDHFDWRHSEGRCTGEDEQGCTCPGFEPSTAPEVYAPWELAAEAYRTAYGVPAAPVTTNGAQEVAEATPAPKPNLEAPRGLSRDGTLPPRRPLDGDGGETVLEYLARTAQAAGVTWDDAALTDMLAQLDKAQIPAHVPAARWQAALGRCGLAWLEEGEAHGD